MLVRSVISDILVINLRRAAQGPDRQLELVLKHPFTGPSAVVRIRQNGDWQAVGLVDVPGRYRFPLPTAESHPHIEIVDDVHGRTILTTQF